MTTSRTFGFYAHHHGRGHLSRIAAVCQAIGPHRCTVTTSHPAAADVLPAGTHLQPLPGDVPPGSPGDVTAGGALHWVPEHPLIAERTHALTGWLRDRAVGVVLVDVSVEVALTVRLAGVPVVVVRLHGDRADAAHDLAHRIAASVLAPFPEALEHPSTPSWVRAKTAYSGFVAPPGTAIPDPAPDGGRRVLVVWGQGHAPPPAAALDAAADVTSGWHWEMVGPPCPDRVPQRVRHLGWVDDVGLHVAGADVVVGPPGDGLVGVVAQAGARFVAVCEPRPFDEHRHKAEALAAVGGAVALEAWPAPSAWPDILLRAEALDPAVLRGLGTEGAERIADHLCRVAGVGREHAA